MSPLTPMMQQYLKTHEEVPDAFLMYRLGDFYEMFFDDAIKASKILDLVLTGRDCGLEERAPMCGVPYHAVDSYVAKLVDKGFKVAICEQIGDPKEAKGLVERKITRIITSGTVTDIGSLSEDKNNYLMSVYYSRLSFGIAYCDITTGEMSALRIDGDDAKDRFYNIVSGIMPAEILVNNTLYQTPEIKERIEYITQRNITPMSSSIYSFDRCVAQITNQLEVYSLSSTGLEGNDEAIKAVGSLLYYLNDTQKGVLKHIHKIDISSDNMNMHIDYATKRNLELTETIRGNTKKGSLLWVLDKTVTNVGSRTLRKWINEPLLNVDEIIKREDVLTEFCSDLMLLEDTQYYLKQTSDIQRLCSKLNYRTIHGKDLIALKTTLEMIPKMNTLLSRATCSYLAQINNDLDPVYEVYNLIDRAINEECSINIKDGNTFKEGYNLQADEIRNYRLNAKNILAKLESDEKEKTGIKNLKVKYNKVFGYYFEVSKGNLDLVPDYFIRKQTLVNAERFYTEELKEVENKLLSAQDELERIETQLFNEIIDNILLHIERLQKTAETIGILDALCSMAYVSSKNRYVRPSINNDGIIDVKNSRHPVVEQISDNLQFIPNDILLDTNNNRMNLITGPNMAGKSTYIRQTALICIMFQIGCFLPCESANMSVVDRVFTRVGASDDLSKGQSTFMVEMSEVSNILKHATKNSLVILDEVGRGTSTLDGLSIAWAVVEYLHNKETAGCKTLFATHYHELTELDSTNEGIVNLHIDIAQTQSGVVFLHKIKQGAADRSYGIEVAKLAGLPEDVISRSEEILYQLENDEDKISTKNVKKTKAQKPLQGSDINLFNYKESKVAEDIKSLPIYDMTPLEVVNFVAKLQQELNK